MKYGYKDIKIDKPGKQIKNIIIEKFGSVEKFADLLGRYPSSIYRYLRSSDCGSHVFKGILVKYLDVGYDDIVVPEQDQVKKLVNDITSNIKIYKEPDDIKTLEKLRKICVKHDLESYKALMQRNIALYHYYNNVPEVAIEMLKTAIEVLEMKGLNQQVFMCLCDLGLVYYYRNDLKNSRKVYLKAETIIEREKLNNNQLYFFYYRYGVLLTNIGKHNESKMYLEKSLEYVTSSIDKGNSYNGIATMFFNEKSYDMSIKYHFEALKYYASDDYLNLGKTYNNLADVYLSSKKYDSALIYINKALDLTKNINTSKYFMYLQTYTQILIELGNADEAINDLISILSNTNTLYIFQNRVISAIRIIIDYSISKNRIDLINRLEIEINRIVMYLSVDSEYSKDLKSLLYEIITIKQRRQ